jgi:hypothetical protein
VVDGVWVQVSAAAAAASAAADASVADDERGSGFNFTDFLPPIPRFTEGGGEVGGGGGGEEGEVDTEAVADFQSAASSSSSSSSSSSKPSLSLITVLDVSGRCSLITDTGTSFGYFNFPLAEGELPLRLFSLDNMKYLAALSSCGGGSSGGGGDVGVGGGKCRLRIMSTGNFTRSRHILCKVT